MGREAKGQKEILEAIAVLPPLAGTAREIGTSPSRPPPAHVDAPLCVARWFDVLDPEALSAAEPHRQRLSAALLLVAALVVVAAARAVVVRTLLPIALVAAAGLVLLRGRRRRSARAASEANRRRLSLEEDRLLLHVKGHVMSHVLLTTSEPFGVTLLATPHRDRVVALLSSSVGAAYVGASVDPASRRAFSALLGRASTVSADEVGLEAIGPDGEPIALAPATLAALVDELASRAPGCLDRFFLTDARGAKLSLDNGELRAGGRVFDLSAPLEWRAFVFQEALGQAIALYQGTWVRQGSNEIVLVCLLPAMTPAPEGVGVSLTSLDRGALRDLRLMQGSPESPPPPDQRVAVDRLLMVPIRSALDKAPRPAAQTARARA